MSNTNDDSNDINGNNSAVIRGRQLDFTNREGDLGFISTSTIGTTDTRNTVKMAPFAPNLGMTDSTRLEASASDMDAVYNDTDAGKQRKNEIGVSPLSFTEANDLNQREKKVNDARILKELEGRGKMSDKKKKIYAGICIAFVFIVIIISVIAANSNNDENGADVEENEDDDDVDEAFNSIIKEEIESICKNFVGSDFVEEDSTGEDEQFIVCIDEVSFIICEKDGDSFDPKEDDCDKGPGNNNKICSCKIGDFIDLRRDEKLDEDDICIDPDDDISESCDFLLDNDADIDLRSFLD